MEEAGGIAREGRRGIYRPVGTVTLDEAVRLVGEAITAARSARIDGLLADITGLTGFDPPDTFQRFRAIEAWVEAAAGRVCLAVVAPPEMIDPRKFGVTVASNRGMVSNIFADEDEALAWLDALLRTPGPTAAESIPAPGTAA
ncbi:MAG: hypothetical protein U0800_24270 [Isosphaeraceae bacterium]